MFSQPAQCPIGKIILLNPLSLISTPESKNFLLDVILQSVIQ